MEKVDLPEIMEPANFSKSSLVPDLIFDIPNSKRFFVAHFQKTALQHHHHHHNL
jgi:hypothetical protein